MTYRKKKKPINLISFLSYKQELIYKLSVRKTLCPKELPKCIQKSASYTKCVLPPTRKWAKRYLSLKNIRTRPKNTE